MSIGYHLVNCQDIRSCSIFYLPDYLTDDLCLGIEVLFVRHRNAMEEQVVLDISWELLDDIRHVADLLLQLLDLVLELLGLLHRRVDLLAAQS